jgi:hypothetical protein
MTNGLSADRTTLNDLFRKQATYEVPPYQRRYSWTEDEIRDLWHDINQGIEYDRAHHMDEITVVPFRSHDPTTFQVIDGQQRLSTLAVLICALRDTYAERGGYERYVDHLHDLLETTDADANPVRRMQLLDEPGDDDQYAAIYSRDEDVPVEGRLTDAYYFYKTRLDDCEPDRLDAVRKYVTNNLSFVRTTVEDLDQAFVMFETTNSRGLDLSALQMSKSILMRIAHRRNKSELKEIQRLWSRVLSHADAADTSKPKRAIKDVLAVTERFDTPLELSNRGFVQHIKDVFERQTDEAVAGLLRWLADELELYEQIKQSRVSQFDRRENAHINSLIRQFTERNSHAGIILYWLFKNHDGVGDLISALDWCAKLSLRLYMSDRTAYKKRDAMHGVYRSLTDGVPPRKTVKNQIRESTPDDRALELQLQQREFKRNDATKYILYRIEAEHFGGSAVNGSPYPTPGEDIEIEHIAPMQAFSAKKYTSWRSEFDNDAELFESERRSLGNLTLLRSRQNQESGTKPFQSKCDAYRTSDFGMSTEIPTQFSTWSFPQIEQRTKRIANLAVRTFTASKYTAEPVPTPESDGGQTIHDFLGETDD